MTTSIGPPPARTGTMLRRLLALTVLVALLGGSAGSRSRSCGTGEPARTRQTPTEAVPPLQVLRIVFPEGFTRAQMAEQITAVNGIAKRKRGVTPRISAERYLALTAEHPFPGRFARDRKRAVARGLPLSGHLRVHGAHDRQGDGREAAGRVSRQLGEGRPALREVEEPDALRRADHRLAGREGGGGARGAGEGGVGDLQPAQGGHAARHRRDHPLRARRARRPSRCASRSSRTRTRTTCASTPA